MSSRDGFYHVTVDISQAKSLPTPGLIGNFSLVILMHGFFTWDVVTSPKIAMLGSIIP